jgi:hypothetical protein
MVRQEMTDGRCHPINVAGRPFLSTQSRNSHSELRQERMFCMSGRTPFHNMFYASMLQLRFLIPLWPLLPLPKFKSLTSLLSH